MIAILLCFILALHSAVPLGDLCSQSSNVSSTLSDPQIFEPLLRTGFGLKLTKSQFQSLDADQIKMMLRVKGALIVSNLDYDDDDFRDLIKSYGKVVTYEGDQRGQVGFGYKDILKLDGEEGKIVTGLGELPLHADGGLLQTRVDVVFLYAKAIQNMHYQGATSVMDTSLAFKEMPPHLMRVLKEERFQSNVLERGYYVNVSPESWFDVPVFNDYGWIQKVLLYFPFAIGQPKSWESRIIGWSDAEILTFFDELKAFLTQPRYYFRHFWKQGDLMIMDNRRVLHAREPFGNGVVRQLWRGQTLDHFPM